MFRRNLNSIIASIFLITLLILPATALAWTLVPSYGETGWKTFTYQASSAFEGNAGFVVSDHADMIVESYLLLDNLSHGGAGSNRGFEYGDFSGFDLYGSGMVQGNFRGYSPTEGQYLAIIRSVNGYSGYTTYDFHNYYNNPGTDGTILETWISLAAGETFSFNWCFITDDYWPYQDFSKFYLKDNQGVIIYEAGLGQLGEVVPLPSTLLFLISGLSMLGLSRLYCHK